MRASSNLDNNGNNHLHGLSKYHQSILSRMASDRQRFVSGKYPVICTVAETPTLKWLVGKQRNNRATCQLLVNGTSVDRSLANYDRFQWLDDDERTELHDKYTLVSWELLAVISMAKPGYVTVMPGTGAGSTSASMRFLDATPTRLWERWKLPRGQVLDELEDQVCRERLWVTGFSLTGRAGSLQSMDTNTGHIESVSKRTADSLLWPNEVSSVPSQYIFNSTVSTRKNGNQLRDAVLVCDGFLVPRKDKGGIYVVKQPGNPNTEWNVCLSDQSTPDKWFYHRATWVDLTGDGRQSILTARATSPLAGSNSNNNYYIDEEDDHDRSNKKSLAGQLVCLECPKPHRIDETTGTPLEKDGTIFDPFNPEHLPWKTQYVSLLCDCLTFLSIPCHNILIFSYLLHCKIKSVLAEGPDVMFSVVDMDATDDTVEVISSQFFGEKVSLHSIQRGPIPKIAFQRTIDEKCGKAFGCIVADLLEETTADKDSLAFKSRRVIDAGSTIDTLQEGDNFSHLLVTSHECSFREEHQPKRSVRRQRQSSNIDDDEFVDSEQSTASIAAAPTQPNGGSLFAYSIPPGKDKWKTEEWKRTIVATGFKVKGQLNNMINPGAPGFVYTFHERKQDKRANIKRRPLIAVAGDCAESAYIFRPATEDDGRGGDVNAKYDLMCEIKCGATVGSIGVGYDDFCETDQESGYAKLYIPCYEDDKILVFGLGSGEDETTF